MPKDIYITNTNQRQLLSIILPLLRVFFTIKTFVKTINFCLIYQHQNFFQVTEILLLYYIYFFSSIILQ